MSTRERGLSGAPHSLALGTALARLEIKTFFEEFVRRVSLFRLTPGVEPVEMPNAFVYGVRSAHFDLEFH